jgi:hypothetical protein
MVWLLFSPDMDKKSEVTTANNQPLGSYLIAGTILALAWAFPALNIVHRWDEALSWKMYSNTQTEASFFSKQPLTYLGIAPYWKRYAYDSRRRLLLDDWAMAELKVPAYNSWRTHKQLARYLCACSVDSSSAKLIRLTVDRWNRNKENWDEIPCRSIDH